MERTFLFTVGAEDAGARLDEFLAARLGGLSRMRIASLLAAGACAVGGAAGRAGMKLRAGDAVEFAPGEGNAPGAMTPEDLPLAVLHEDDHLLVVVKPAGLLVHPTRGVKTGTLANALTHHLNRLRIADRGSRIEEGNESASPAEPTPTPTEPESHARTHAPGGPHPSPANPRAPAADPETPNPQSEFRNPRWVRPGLVHRLDRETSGLLVVAKTQRALSSLSRQFHRRRVSKLYLALVGGVVGADARTIEAAIGRADSGPPWWRVTADGRPAETRLRVLERGARATLVELEPVTGRTNQLRIHCAHAGNPIVGDAWYGGEPAARLCLHAARLAFNHPEGGERVEFRSPLPPEIAALLR